MCPGDDSTSKNEYQVNPGGKGGPCVRLTTYHLHVPMSRNPGALTSWNPVGLFRPVIGQLFLHYLHSMTMTISYFWCLLFSLSLHRKYFNPKNTMWDLR
jgi:hypothetical protein